MKTLYYFELEWYDEHSGKDLSQKGCLFADSYEAALKAASYTDNITYILVKEVVAFEKDDVPGVYYITDWDTSKELIQAIGGIK